MDNIRIRTFWGPMPFDRADASGFGLVHATGREIFRDGRWTYEYEDDITVDLPDTDDPVDYDDYLEEDEEDEEIPDLPVKTRAIRRDATRKAKKHDLNLATHHLINKQVKTRKKNKRYVVEDKNNNNDRVIMRNKYYNRPHNYLWSEDEEYAWDDMDALWDDYDDYKTFTRHWGNWLNDEHPDGYWDTDLQRFIPNHEEDHADN